MSDLARWEAYKRDTATERSLYRFYYKWLPKIYHNHAYALLQIENGDVKSR